ncbi:hypothetical protein QMP26_41115 (plasmid) [Enterocloster clostridioformis]
MENKKTWRKLIPRMVLVIGLALLLVLLFEQAAYAEGWIDGTDSPIYSGGMTGDRKNDVSEILNIIWQSIKNLTSDLLGALFSDMIRNTGDSLYYLLSLAGIDLNAIVYGRVGGAAIMSDDVALFTFELVPGNPYGIVAMYMYGAIRMIFVLVIICVLLGRLSAFLYTSAGGRQRERLKETSTTSVILVLMVILMPYVLGVVLFLRDVVLYVIMARGGELIQKVSDTIYPDFLNIIGRVNPSRIFADIHYAFYGAAGKYNLITMFRDAAGGNLLNSLMYVGAVVLTLYFAVAYISAALSQVVLVVSFPMACVGTLFDRSIIKNWLKQFAGVLMIPIIDSFLMLIPIFFGLLGKSQSVSGYTLLQLILCCCIIPARGCVRLWLGFGGANGMELAGIGALMGAMQLGKAIAGVAIGIGAKSLAAGKLAASDESLADMFTERQQAKKLSEVGATEQLDKDIQDMFGIPGAGQKNEDASPGQAGERGANQGGGAAELKDKIGELEKRKAVIADQMKKNDVRSAEIMRQSSALDEDIASLKADKESARAMGPQGQGRVSECDRLIAENELAKKKLGSEAAEIRRDNAVKSGQISRLDAVAKRARDAIVSMRAAGGGAALPDGEQEVLDKYANIDNFETPEFKNISMERKAELYRERARVTRSRARLQTALEASGAVAGATMAFGATMFGSPAVKMYGTALGIQAGAGIAAMAEEASYNHRAAASYQHISPVSAGGSGSNYVTLDAPRIEDRTGTPLRITQKQTVQRQMIVDKEIAVETVMGSGTTNTAQTSDFKNFGDENHGWVYGGTASDERIWNDIITDPNGQKRVSVEVRRALTAASSGVRIMRKNLDGDFSKTSEEKNMEILENAMNTFSSEFSFNVINNGLIPDGARYDTFDSDAYMDYLENKVRTQAAEILKEKLQSLGLLY